MNSVTVLLISIFMLPVLTGILIPFSGDIGHALHICTRRLELVFSFLMSLFLATLAFSRPESSLWNGLYSAVPPLYDSVAGQDIWLFLIAASVLLVFFSSVMRLARLLLWRPVLMPLFHFLSGRYLKMSGAAKRMLGGIMQLPRSVGLLLIFFLLFHFYIVLTNNASLGNYIGQSSVYRMLNAAILQPALSSGFSEEVPDMFNGLIERAVRNTSLNRLPELTYFNGVPLRDAVESNDDLDTLARELTAGAAQDREKAYLLYKWVCGNIAYDFEKVQTLSNRDFTASSGALDAYAAGSGVCFDYSCLYISMCRAADVGVRFVAGKGLSGGVWAEHVWNQVYDPAEGRWINVDTTFGSAGEEYFDRAHFSHDHSGGTVLGQW